MSIERSKCPTCGGAVVIHTADEGTSHMVPANSADQTEAFIERDQLRAGIGFAREYIEAALDRATGGSRR
jgi:hypothetical protein